MEGSMQARSTISGDKGLISLVVLTSTSVGGMMAMIACGSLKSFRIARWLVLWFYERDNDMIE